jgi:hypothetical protein
MSAAKGNKWMIPLLGAALGGGIALFTWGHPKLPGMDVGLSFQVQKLFPTAQGSSFADWYLNTRAG